MTGADNDDTPTIAAADSAGHDAVERRSHERKPGGVGDPVRALEIAGEEAKTLLENLRDIALDEDDDAKQISIESETSLPEALEIAAELILSMEAMAASIKMREAALEKRRFRIEDRADLVRAAVQTAMQSAQMKRHVTTVATLTVKAVAPKVIITDEALVPSTYWKRADPTLDRKAILDALKYGTTVTGAELSNGGETLQVKP